jgi:DNA-binding beta-propeller fold protein YncE
MIVGTGDFTYEVAEGWGSFPEGWKLGWIAAVAVDSRDRVYLYNRSEHPLVVLDRDGSFSSSWAEDILLDAHGILIDERDHVFCVEREIHCMRRFSPAGELTMTLGTPRKQGAEGEPFRQPTDIAFDSKGDMYISDGYDNARVHKFTADGEHIKSWGSPGAGPGQFDTPHCVRVDRNDRVLVCDRSNNRVQIFDTEGEFLSEWGNLNQPDTIHIDQDDIVYIAELDQRVSILSLEGELLCRWGKGERLDAPGEFRGCPHGIWTDSRGDLYVSEVQTDQRVQKFIRQR